MPGTTIKLAILIKLIVVQGGDSSGNSVRRRPRNEVRRLRQRPRKAPPGTKISRHIKSTQIYKKDEFNFTAKPIITINTFVFLFFQTYLCYSLQFLLPLLYKENHLQITCAGWSFPSPRKA